MIIHCKSGAAIVVNECHWTPGAFLAVNNSGGGTGVIIGPAELDQVRAELDRIAGAIADRQTPKDERKVA